jgi:hypothetical protein
MREERSMQISGRTSNTTNDAGSQRGARTPVRNASAGRDEGDTSVVVSGGYDPSARVALSADTLLFLSRTKRIQEKYPPLTRDEWNNKLSPQLAAREYQAFGKFSETGDHKAYYRAFIDYYDNLRPEDQDSLRYFGTRDAAVTGLRSTEYEDEAGMTGEDTFHTLVDVLLDDEKPVSNGEEAGKQPLMITGDMFGWDSTAISYEDTRETPQGPSEIERMYRETF